MLHAHCEPICRKRSLHLIQSLRNLLLFLPSTPKIPMKKASMKKTLIPAMVTTSALTCVTVRAPKLSRSASCHSFSPASHMGSLRRRPQAAPPLSSWHARCILSVGLGPLFSHMHLIFLRSRSVWEALRAGSFEASTACNLMDAVVRPSTKCVCTKDAETLSSSTGPIEPKRWACTEHVLYLL